LKGHSWRIRSFSISPDNRSIVSGSADDTIKIWDGGCGIEVKTLTGHQDWVERVSFSCDGRHIFSTSLDRTVKIWDPGTGKDLATLKGHTSSIYAYSHSPDCRFIATGSRDQTLRIWCVNKLIELRKFITPSFISAVSFSNDGRTLFAGDSIGNVYILRLENLPIGPPILSPWHSPEDNTHAYGCTLCRKWSEVPESALGSELDCPKCGETVKLNPFTINADWRPIAKGWGDDSHTGK